MNNDDEGWLDLELDDSDLDDGADGEDVFESLAVAHRESAIAARTAAAEAGQKRPRGGDDDGEAEAERSRQPRREAHAGPADDDIAAAVGALCERTQQPGPTPGFGMDDDVLPSLDRADRAAIPQRREVQPLWISDDDDDSLGGLGDRNSGDPHRAGVARLPNLPGPIGRLQRARARDGATSTGRGGGRKANDAALIAALEDEADFESRPWLDAVAALGSHGTAEETRHSNGKAPPLGPGIASVLAGPGAARKITNVGGVRERIPPIRLVCAL